MALVEKLTKMYTGGVVELEESEKGPLGHPLWTRREDDEFRELLPLTPISESPNSEPPKFDLETYIGNYTGRTRYERLLLIGLCSTYFGVEALKLAVREAKAGKDARRYSDAVTHLLTIGPQEEEEASRDQAWLDRIEKQNQIDAGRLETELKGYKTNLIKESIRMGNEDLGAHYQATGDLPRAFEAFSRMRQDIVVSSQVIGISRHLIEVAVEQRNWVAVTSNVQKMKSVADPEEAKAIQPFTMAADGLSHLDAGNFYDAALSFLQTEAGMGTSCNTIIAPNDIATYGGLCALATMERNELNSKVLENSGFRTYLELEPHIRRAITFFVNSRYSACLSILESYRADYFLDIHLQKHIDDIYSMVRSKSIVQYFIPFSCVTLDSLNQAFAAPGKTIDKELASMIQRKELHARIDTQNRLLTSVPSSPRGALHTEALETAKGYEREARRRIQHMNITRADLEIKSNKPRLPGALSSFGEDFYESGGRELRSKGFSHGGF